MKLVKLRLLMIRKRSRVKKTFVRISRAQKFGYHSHQGPEKQKTKVLKF